MWRAAHAPATICSYFLNFISTIFKTVGCWLFASAYCDMLLLLSFACCCCYWSCLTLRLLELNWNCCLRHSRFFFASFERRACYVDVDVDADADADSDAGVDLNVALALTASADVRFNGADFTMDRVYACISVMTLAADFAVVIAVNVTVDVGVADVVVGCKIQILLLCILLFLYCTFLMPRFHRPKRVWWVLCYNIPCR